MPLWNFICLVGDVVSIPFQLLKVTVKVRFGRLAGRFKVYPVWVLHMSYLQGRIGEKALCSRLWLWQIKDFEETHRVFNCWFTVRGMDINNPSGLTREALQEIALYAKQHPDVVRYWELQNFTPEDEGSILHHILQLDRLIERDLEKAVRRWHGDKNMVRREN